MAFKSILGATCACLAVVSINVNAVVLEERFGGIVYSYPYADSTWLDVFTRLADVNAGTISLNDYSFSAIDGDIMWQSDVNWDCTVCKEYQTFTAADIVAFIPIIYSIPVEHLPTPIIWPDRYGDVSIVPVPATVWLFGSGLIGLIGIARRKKV